MRPPPMVSKGRSMVKSAMILAAGLGQRMRPLTETLPKPLIPVAGKSMLERTFEHLNEAKISHIVVNTHYLAPLIVERVKALYPQTILSHEDILLETGGGIKKALPLLRGDPFFVLNGDSIWIGTESLKSLEKNWDERKMEGVLLLIPREKAYGYEGRGDFFMDPQGGLYRPKKGHPAPYVFIGVQLLGRQLFHNAPSGPFSLNLLWDEALAKNRLYGHIHQGEWFHISTPQDITQYEPILSSIQV
jgi:MurNAc alpha-1-phosphate uridylyltransferase